MESGDVSNLHHRFYICTIWSVAHAKRFWATSSILGAVAAAIGVKSLELPCPARNGQGGETLTRKHKLKRPSKMRERSHQPNLR